MIDAGRGSSGAPSATPIIRDAVPGDEHDVARVHVRAWQVAYRGLLPDDYLDALQPEERAARYRFGTASTAGPQTMLAVNGQTILGFATIGPSRDDDASEAGELYALYVDSDGWGRGTGRALMAAARARLQAIGAEEAILWVLAGNVQAQRFYAADGWRPDGTRRVEEPFGVTAEVIRYRRALDDWRSAAPETVRSTKMAR